MQKIEMQAYFGDKAVHVEISAPYGIGGNSYHVMINKYYNGGLTKSYDGWRVHLHPKTILQGDDVSVLIDLIEQKLI